jgi:hypothetical protein
MVLPDKDVKIILECSNSDLRFVNSEVDSDHSADDVAVVDMLVSSNEDDNKVVGRNTRSYV